MSSVLDDKRKKPTAGEEYIEQNGKRYKKVNFDEIPNNHAAAREAGYTIFRNSNGGIIGALEGTEADNKGNYYASIGGEWYEVVDNPIAKKAGRTFGTAQPTAAVTPAKETSTPAAQPTTTTAEQSAATAQTPVVKEEVPVATTQTPIPAAPTAVEDVQQNEDGGKKTILWPDRPEMEKGNYVEQTDAQIAQAQKSAAEQERRAKRDRDMAIISDIANLVTKGAAMHGGAWKIDKEEARSAVANDKLRALRESNSKLLAEYARQRMEAADAQRKERNAERKAEYDAAVDKAKLLASIARTDAELKEKKRHQEVLEDIAQQNADTRKTAADNQGKGGGSGSGKVKDMRYIGDWAFDYNDDKAVVEAYSKMVQADPGKIITEEFVTSRGKKVEKAVSNPSVNQMRRALVNGGMTATPPSANKGKTAVGKTMPGVTDNNKKMPGVK